MSKKDNSNISVSGSVSVGVMNRDGGFVFDDHYYFDPEHRWQQDLLIAKWCKEKYAPYPIYNAEAHLVQLQYRARPYRQVGGLQPQLILGSALGAELQTPGNMDPDIAITPLKGIKIISELKDICWEEREPISTFLKQIKRYKKQYRDQNVDIFPPFFWDRSGRATIHGPLTTAHKLIGEDFFTLPFSDPDLARDIVLEIAHVYKHLIALFSEKAELPVSGIHIGECSGSLFSAELWEQLAIPAMNILADTFGSVRIHSCGKSDHLLGQMKNVHHVTIVNIGSNTNITQCRQLFGADIKIDVTPDLHLLNNGNPGDITAWVKKSLNENKSGPLEFQFHLDSGIPYENIVAIFKALQAEGINV